MKKIFISFFLVILMCSFCSCGASNAQSKEEQIEKKLQGVWVVETGKAIIEYKFDNGTFSAETTALGVSMGEKPGTYTIGDNIISLKYDNGVTADLEFTYENNKLTIYNSSDKIFSKQ